MDMIEVGTLKGPYITAVATFLLLGAIVLAGLGAGRCGGARA